MIKIIAKKYQFSLTWTGNPIYQYIINTFSKKVEFVKKTFRLKNFIFHFITVGSEWIGQNVLKLHTIKNYKVLLL